MSVIAMGLVAFVAVLHAGFLVLEMFLWQKPIGMKVFRNTPEKAAITAVLAANQGLYNGFLSAGLFWSLVAGPMGPALATFFCGCVVVAAGYGAVSVSPRIFLVQGVPALLALGAVQLL